MAQGLIRSDKTRDGIAAVLAVNLAELEDQMYERQQQWTAEQAAFAGMQAELEQAGLLVLNRPNLLKQPQFVSANIPSSSVISYSVAIPAETAAQAAENLTYTVTDENITSSYVLIGIRSTNHAIAGMGNMSCVAGSGTATITVGPRNNSAAHDALTVTAYLCTVQSASLPYGTISRHYASGQPYLDSHNDEVYPGEVSDEITESVVTLTGNDIITEADGETYNKAIAFTVTNPPSSGWGNSDRMIWNYGAHGAGATPVALPSSGEYYGDLPLVVGEKYTLSCWARITSGTKASLWMGVDPGHYWKHPNGYEYHEIEANGGAWQRVVFEFTFNPTGDHFYTYTSNNTSYQGANWVKTVGIGVCRKYAGTVQLTGFRLVRGKLYICETYDDLDEDLAATKARVTALEQAVAALTPAAGQSF